MNDRHEKGRYAVKVSDYDVAQMRVLKSRGEKTKDIAQKFGLSITHTLYLIAGKPKKGARR